MDNNRTRAERRYQTERRSRRARRIEHHVRHGPRRRTCDCPDTIGRNRRSKAFACRCRGKQKGAPKLAGSLHKAGYTYRGTTMRRIWNKRLARAWHAAIGTVDPDDIELPSGAITGRRRGTWPW
ncbi:MAG: hypothetical protein AB7R89_03850 [Dehalococcoidia bacterium]